jgi:hypothetical protein
VEEEGRQCRGLSEQSAILDVGSLEGRYLVRAVVGSGCGLACPWRPFFLRVGVSTYCRMTSGIVPEERRLVMMLDLSGNGCVPLTSLVAIGCA